MQPLAFIVLALFALCAWGGPAQSQDVTPEQATFELKMLAKDVTIVEAAGKMCANDHMNEIVENVDRGFTKVFGSVWGDMRDSYGVEAMVEMGKHFEGCNEESALLALQNLDEQLTRMFALIDQL